MIFFLRLQHANLQKQAADLAARKSNVASEPVYGTRTALENSNHKFQIYVLSTKSTVDKLLSFVPFTEQFRARRECVAEIHNAWAKLKEVEKNIKAAEKAAKSVVRVRATSDSDVHQPRHYKSPLDSKRRSQDDTSVNYGRTANLNEFKYTHQLRR